MAENDGGPAFPSLHPYPQGGMSLRDYFAGQFLATTRIIGTSVEGSVIAENCYRMADAMLKERTK